METIASQLGDTAARIQPWKMLHTPMAQQLGRFTANPQVRNMIPGAMAPLIHRFGSPGIIGTSVLRNMGSWQELTRGAR